jgi:hypothetical protein
VLPFVAKKLAARMEDVGAAVPDAVNVIADLGEPAVRKPAGVRL